MNHRSSSSGTEWNTSDEECQRRGSFTSQADEVETFTTFIATSTTTSNSWMSHVAVNTKMKKGKMTSKCIFCPEIHFLTNCLVPLKQKMEMKAREKWHIKFLSSQHRKLEFKSTWACRRCGDDYHTSIFSQKSNKSDERRKRNDVSIQASVQSITLNSDEDISGRIVINFFGRHIKLRLTLREESHSDHRWS